MIDLKQTTLTDKPVADGRDRRATMQYEQILTQLQCHADGDAKPLRGIGVVGLDRGDGASTVAANLALVASRSQLGSVLLIDADESQPSVHEVFRIASHPGVCDVLSGGAEPLDCIRESTFAGLSILPAGEANGHARLPQNSAPAAELFGALCETYDFVFVDLPPIGESRRAIAWARLLTGVVLVLEAEGSRRSAALRAKQQLQQAGVNILGIVLNKRCHHLPNWLYRVL